MKVASMYRKIPIRIRIQPEHLQGKESLEHRLACDNQIFRVRIGHRSKLCCLKTLLRCRRLGRRRLERTWSVSSSMLKFDEANTPVTVEVAAETIEVKATMIQMA